MKVAFWARHARREVRTARAVSADPARHEAKAQLRWHNCQNMLKSDKSTRGVGIVAYTEAAMALLKEAQAVARKRIQVKLDAKRDYEAKMRL